MTNDEHDSSEAADELAEYVSKARRVLVTREGLRYADGTKPKGIK